MRAKMMPFTTCLLVAAVLSCPPAAAQEREPSAGVSRLSLQIGDLSRDKSSYVAPALLPPRTVSDPGLLEEAGPPASAVQQPVLVEYSDAYRVRARLHRIASFATVPLFATELFLGESLYDHPTDSKKEAHLAVAAGIGGLFGVNSVTGVWNLVEARRDPNGRGRRWLHGLLMLAADAGFFATAALAPGDDGEEEGRVGGEGGGSRSTHRAVAFTSIGIASAGYLVTLFGGR